MGSFRPTVRLIVLVFRCRENPFLQYPISRSKVAAVDVPAVKNCHDIVVRSDEDELTAVAIPREHEGMLPVVIRDPPLVAVSQIDTVVPHPEAVYVITGVTYGA